jgi:hypothetical protein
MQKRGFPGSEEECLVFSNWSTDCAAEIVEVYVWREELISVHVAALEGVAGAEI